MLASAKYALDPVRYDAMRECESWGIERAQSIGPKLSSDPVLALEPTALRDPRFSQRQASTKVTSVFPFTEPRLLMMTKTRDQTLKRGKLFIARKGLL